MENVYYDIDSRTMERENLKTPFFFYRIEKTEEGYFIQELEGKHWCYGGVIKGLPNEVVGEEFTIKRLNKKWKKILNQPFVGNEPLIYE